MAFDPASIINFQEPSLTRMSNGRLVSMIRVLFRPARYDYQWVTHSEDDGVTWAPPTRDQAVGVSGRHDPAPGRPGAERVQLPGQAHGREGLHL